MPSSPKQKRATQPKVKGCYECSQRRISCDRTRPCCSKCLAKGLQCSGLGVRYRFEKGIASRGKLVGKQMPEVSAGRRIFGSSLACPEQPPSTDAEPEPHDKHVIDFSQSCTTHACLNTIANWKRPFLAHFSAEIAPHMLAIDDPSNGWRHLLLPVAVDDEVVMDAVVAASAYHVSAKSPAALSLAQAAYTKAVNGLLKRQDFKSYDPLTNCFSVMGILVLLVATMVTGCSDFPIVFRMLKSAFEVVKDEGSENHELSQFLQLQISKFHVYGEPFVSESDGIEVIQKWGRKSLGCLQHCALRHPQRAPALSNIQSQIEQAHNIYLRRALDDLDPFMSVQLVERFICTANNAPSSATGHHVLVWATFIAAAESSTSEHRAFFVERFNAFYNINGFQNNLKALEFLRTLWRNDAVPKWTSMLPQARMFIV